MPAAPIIIGAAVASGAAAAIGGAIVGGTILAGAATAVGVGVISGISTAIQGGSAGDVLKSAVIGGVSSYVGGAIASKVTSTVAAQTGASLVDLEPALRSMSGEGITGAGAAAIVAGNVAGSAAVSAITGRPIEQGALLGLAQSIPTALTASSDYNKLNPVVQNVLASSAQAAVIGQDIGDAALAALVSSSGIVAKAIEQVPGGQDFIKDHPIYSKYVIESVSSALTAQLQGKDVPEAVVYSLARTTADVLKEEFKNSKKMKDVEDAQSSYKKAMSEEEKLNSLIERRNGLIEDPKYKSAINNANSAAAWVNSAASDLNSAASNINYYANMYNDPGLDSMYRENAAAQRASLLSFYNQAKSDYDTYSANYKREEENYREANRILSRTGFYDEQTSLDNQINDSRSLLDEFTTELENYSKTLASTSEQLFSDFETKVSPVFLPSDIGVEVAGDVNRDAIRGTFVVPFAGETFYKEDDKKIIEPGPDNTFEPIETNYRYITGYKNDGTQYLYMIDWNPISGVTYTNVSNAEDIVAQRQAAYNEFAQYDTTEPGEAGTGTGAGISLGDASQAGAGTGAGTGVGVGTETGTGVGVGTETGTGAGTASTDTSQAGAGTGTGAPPVDYSLAATDMQGTPMGEQPPFPTIGLNLLTAGTGIEGGKNRAFFNTRGGFGSGNNLTETTWSLVTRASDTGSNDVVDVGGKLYSLVVLPDRQVLVPKEPTPVEVFVEVRQDPATNTPIFEEVEADKVPAETYLDIAKEMAKETGAPAGGAATGAEGATGGREGAPATSGSSADAGALETRLAEESRLAEEARIAEQERIDRELAEAEAEVARIAEARAAAEAEAARLAEDARIAEELRLDDLARQAEERSRLAALEAERLAQAETEAPTGTGAPGSGGFGTGTEPGGGEEGVVPGGGTGTGVPGGTGEGPARGEEGTGTGTGTEGTGIGQGGTGTGTGTGEGDGTGEGGGQPRPTVPRQQQDRRAVLGSGLSAFLATRPSSSAEDTYGPFNPLLTGGQTAKFEGPLQEFLEKVEGQSYTGQDPFMAPEGQQSTPETTDMNAQPAPSYFNYGKSSEIDDTLNVARGIDSQISSMFNPFRAPGVGTPMFTFKEGGLSTPMFNEGGTTRYGRYAGGGLNVIHHSGKPRVDFREGDAVTGPGDGQSDDIPAMLADGEFVFPADVVAALGNGSTKAGSDKLYDMMHSIRSQARSAHPKDLPPPAKSPLDYLKDSPKKGSKDRKARR